MTSPYSEVFSPQAASEPKAAAPQAYAPSVPISVYRELAAELKTTRAMVEALTTQNQQLSHQNQVLRQEFLRFAQSADQLRQAVEATQVQPERAVEKPAESIVVSEPRPTPPAQPDSLTQLAERATRLVKKPSAPKPRPKTPPLFTEQRLEPGRLQQGGSAPKDMSGLWLATTILLIVVSAFGAGFLIMRPLMNSGR